MDLTIYDIIRKPRVTEKASRLNKMTGKLVLEVHPQANKPLIAQALKKIFNVDAHKIGIVIMKGKRRRSGKHFSTGVKRKKAIITLKEGQSIDIMGLSEPQKMGAE